MPGFILICHVIAGGIALLSGVGAIVFRNKVNIHKKFGIVYFWAMTFIFFSAIYLSVLKSNIFLFCVAFFSYYQCLVAFRSLKLKKIHIGEKPRLVDWLVEIFFGIVHVGFIAFACWQLMLQNYSYGIVSFIFGVIGIRGNLSTIKRLRGNIVYKNYWLQAHAGGMIGSYIGAITAFTVNNNRWIHIPELVAWLGPTVVLVPFISFEIKKLKKTTLRISEGERLTK